MDWYLLISASSLLISLYALFSSQRSKAHSYYNAEDIARHDQILYAKFPELYELYEMEQVPEEIEMAPENIAPTEG